MMRRTKRRGANAVEFALLLPVFVLLVGGSVDLSWLMLQRGAMRSAVSRGCRAGSLVDPGLKESAVADVHTRAQNAIRSLYEGSVGACPGCVVNTTMVGAIPNRALRCNLVAPWDGLTPALSEIQSGDLTDEVVVRLEFQRDPT
ncbi:MAG: TadE/TadG family type IV pilus assembly protein [Myxococcota bacterium]